MRNLEIVYLVYGLAMLFVHAAKGGPDFGQGNGETDTQKPPNIVILMVDDLGIGDIGCFGNDSIKTPNIDKLASEGAQLDHNLAASPVCTPSRAAFLTGRYAIRAGMVSWPTDNKVLVRTAVKGGLPANEVTFSKVLQRNGYKTGFVGKWHLGLNCNTSRDLCHHPKNHGFEHFYGLPHTNQRECANDYGSELSDFSNSVRWFFTALLVLVPAIFAMARLGMLNMAIATFLLLSCILITIVPDIADVIGNHWFDCILMRGDESVEQPIEMASLTHRLTTDAVRFIEKNRKDPFLIFMSFAKVHTALATSKHFVNHSKHGRYGDNVEEMDWAVGKILEKIESLGLFEHTMVYFTSDHGPHLEEVAKDGEMHGGYQGHFKGGKGTNWEGGIRVPTIIRWPNRIRPGTKINVPTSSLDFFPTVLRVAQVEVPRNLDGQDILGILTGESTNALPERFLFHYCDVMIHAVTFADYENAKKWKVHYQSPQFSPGKQGCAPEFLCPCFGDGVNIHSPPLVFDLDSDPGEASPVSSADPEIQRVLQRSKDAVEQHKQSVTVLPSQFSSRTFLPWLQPCCSPPLCSCKENFPHELIPFTEKK